MKVLVFITLISTAFGVPLQTKESCACIDVYDPVCGSDFVTYDNTCRFQCAQASNPDLTIFSQGACPSNIDAPENEELTADESSQHIEISDCFCSMDYRPVCGREGSTLHTYGNLCFFNCARKENPILELAAQGECPKGGLALINQVRPHHQLKPIPYVVSKTKGKAYDPCVCTKEYRPVCGFNGADMTTYPNPCELRCAAKADPGLQLVSYGTC